MKLFSQGSARIGVCVYDRSIEMVEIQKDEGGLFHIVAFAEAELESGIVERGNVHDVERLSSALKKLWGAETKFSTKTVYLALPDDVAYFHVFRFPGILSETEVQNALAFQFEEIFPLSFSDAAGDFAIVAQSSDETIVQYAVTSQETLAQYNEAITRAGLTLGGIGLEAQAITRVLVTAPHEKKASLIVNITKSGTTLCIRDTFGLYASLKAGVFFEHRATDSQPDTALSRDPAEALSKEILNVSDWYRRNASAAALDEVVIAGNGQRISILADEVRKILERDMEGVAVRVGDIFGRLADHEGQLFAKKQYTTLFTPAIGAAFQGLENSERSFEFLPSVGHGRSLANPGTPRHAWKWHVPLSFTPEDIRMYIATVPERTKILLAGACIFVALAVFGGAVVLYLQAQNRADAELQHLRLLSVQRTASAGLNEHITVALVPEGNDVPGRLITRTITKTITLAASSTNKMLSQQDVDTAVQRLTVDLNTQINDLFATYVHSDERFVSGLARVGSISVHAVPPIESGVSSSILTVTFSARALVFKSDDFDATLRTVTSQQMSANPGFSLDSLKEMRIQVDTLTEELDRAQLTVTVYPQG